MGNFPEGFPLTVYLCDSLATQLKTLAKGHQLCPAHIIRELTLFIEKDESRRAGQIRDILSSAMELKKRMRNIDYHQCAERDGIVNRFDRLVSQPATHETKKEHALQKRLMKYRDEIITFLYEPDVPPNNSASERAIRNYKGQTESLRGIPIGPREGYLIHHQIDSGHLLKERG